MLHISLLTQRILLLTVSFHLYPRKLTFSTLKEILQHNQKEHRDRVSTAEEHRWQSRPARLWCVHLPQPALCLLGAGMSGPHVL
jgi:hypothetical protein